ncbi:lysophospholipase L1-like esterase [Streptomyces glaucescens]
MEQGMRNRRHRSWAALAAVTAAAVLGVTGCDAVGGASSAPPGDEAGLVKPSSPPAWDSTPRSIAAVGDSITTGFNTCVVLADCPEVSWATGTSPDVDSLAVRLLGRSRVASHSWNYAVSGARMADLPRQMARAAAREPELVTVLAGANDACRTSADDMTPVADFRAGFREALHTLRRSGAPKAQVFVASVPDLKRLWSQGRTNALGKQVWKLGICPSMLDDADSLDAEDNLRRSAVEKRVESYNEVLREECAKDRYCRFDGDAVHEYRFGTGQLSRWDWFHPSVDGQARLAEIAYEVVTAQQAPS